MGATVRGVIAFGLVNNISFLWTTLLINVFGALMIGWIFGKTSISARQSAFFHLLTTGFLGAFTTMSAFGWESWQLIVQDAWLKLFIYMILSAFLGPWMAWIGFQWGQKLKGGETESTP